MDLSMLQGVLPALLMLVQSQGFCLWLTVVLALVMPVMLVTILVWDPLPQRTLSIILIGVALLSLLLMVALVLLMLSMQEPILGLLSEAMSKRLTLIYKR